MKRHKLKIHLVQMEVVPGQPSVNTEKMLKSIAAAKKAAVHLVVFPELAVPGYLIGDLWERDAFLRECESCGNEIRQASDGIIVVFGNVAMDWKRRNEDGRVRKYNALFVAADGKFIGPLNGLYEYVIKSLLPNYREFDDSRYFYDQRKLASERGVSVEDIIAPVKVKGLSLGCVLCEDAWDSDYGFSPLTVLGQKGVDLIINISSSPFTLHKNHKRNRVYAAHASRLKKPLLFVNCVGIQNNGKTIYTFDGASCIYDGGGRQLCLPQCFKEDVLAFDLPLSAAGFGEPVSLRKDGIDKIYDALFYGASQFLKLCGISRVVVGISGGIDSAVVAALYSRILKRENLLLVNMPSRFNSPTTVSLARLLAKNLNCYYTEATIEEVTRLTARQVEDMKVASADGALKLKLKLTGFMLENVQARDRSARLLAAIAAAFGGVFSCNANKSEATVGYSTLYGDLAGFLVVLGDLWKGEIYQLGRYMNEHVFRKEIIPAGCFTLAPSAELSAAQAVDQGRGDPLIYPYHDKLFASWMEWWQKVTPEENLEWYMQGSLEEHLGYEGKISGLFPNAEAFIADLERWWQLYLGMAVAKRIQAPPILAVKRRAFGFDHRESQLGAWYSRRYLDLKRKLLR